MTTLPSINLESARWKAEDARVQVANGIDPSEIRKNIKIAKTHAILNEKLISEGFPILNSFGYVTKR